MSETSPTPWIVKPDERTETDRSGTPYGYIGGYDIFAADGTEIVGCEGILGDGERHAKQIVRAVNSHDGLVEALTTAKHHLSLFCTRDDQIADAVFDMIDAALSKATQTQAGG